MVSRKKKVFFLIGAIAILVTITVILLLFLLKSRNDPIMICEKALAKENEVKIAKEVVMVNLKNNENQYLSLNFSFTQDKGTGLLAGDLNVLFNGKQIDTKVFQQEMTTYLQQDNDNCIVVSAKIDEIFGKKTYRQQIINLFKNDEVLHKSLKILKEDNRVKSVVFRIPRERVRSIFETAIKPVFFNERIKQTAVKQVMAQLQENFKGQISDEEIEKIVQEQREELYKKIESILASIDIADAEYTVSVNKEGFLIKESLSVQLKKDNVPLNFVYSHTIDGINGNYNLSIPDFSDNANMVKANGFSGAFAILFK